TFGDFCPQTRARRYVCRSRDRCRQLFERTKGKRGQSMKPRLGSLVAGVMIAIVGSGTWWFFHESRATSQAKPPPADKAESSQGPIASVKVVPVKKGTLAEEITVYGTIVPAAGAVQTITEPFERRVRGRLATTAQK